MMNEVEREYVVECFDKGVNDAAFAIVVAEVAENSIMHASCAIWEASKTVDQIESLIFYELNCKNDLQMNLLVCCILSWCTNKRRYRENRRILK